MSDIRDAAIHCEAKKHAYRQTQDGVVVSFVLHPQEVPDGLATAALGTRYMLALVAIGDDEKPLAPQPEPTPAATKERRAFDTLVPAQQAGIWCNDPAFWKYLSEKYPGPWERFAHDDKITQAAGAVRHICGVNSRASIKPTNDKWASIVDGYRLWQRYPELVG